MYGLIIRFHQDTATASGAVDRSSARPASIPGSWARYHAITRLWVAPVRRARIRQAALGSN